MPDTASIAVTQKTTFCRLCQGLCGMILTLDEDKRLVGLTPDHDDQQSLGYACFRGMQAVETHYGDERILHPLKRQPDGSFIRIGLEQALDEIAAQLRSIADRDGPDAVAGYKGTAGYFNSAASTLLCDWLTVLGSPKFFTSFTIDQSAKLVAGERIGVWLPGLQPLRTSDIWLLIGSNPLIAAASMDFRNPQKRMKQGKARGLKLIVIDPRYTETARFADIFVQPLPGEDATILAGMIRIILANGWHDREFCERYVGDLDRLRDAVEPFTPDYVARRADIPGEQLQEITEAFAVKAKRGCVASATGPNMGPHSNLTEHLVVCVNIICGRYVREGEEIGNPGFLLPRYPRPTQVIPPTRSWERGPKSRIADYGTIAYGTSWSQMLTGILPDEILKPGKGQVKALICHGGNPVTAIPDQRKTVRALRSLALLVSIEPYMTATAKISHYILPPLLIYERADLPLWWSERTIYPTPYTRYTAPMIEPPAGSEVAEEGYIFWALAKRLGLALLCDGVPLDMTTPPTTDDFLAIIARHAPVPFEEIKQQPYGVYYDAEPQFAIAGDPNATARFTLMPDDVYPELKALAVERIETGRTFSHGQTFSHRLAGRRIRDRYNSFGHSMSKLRHRVPYNVAYLNPRDMTERGIATGDWIEITSDSGTIKVIAEADETVRSGVISMAHAFGDLREDGEPEDFLTHGASPNLLISTDRDLQDINAMPRMSAIPVNFRKTKAPSMTNVAVLAIADLPAS
jgi:anaerobic selenocysteine-containing dehydrogenase